MTQTLDESRPIGSDSGYSFLFLFPHPPSSQISSPPCCPSHPSPSLLSDLQPYLPAVHLIPRPPSSQMSSPTCCPSHPSPSLLSDLQPYLLSILPLALPPLISPALPAVHLIPPSLHFKLPPLPALSAVVLLDPPFCSVLSVWTCLIGSRVPCRHPMLAAAVATAAVRTMHLYALRRCILNRLVSISMRPEANDNSASLTSVSGIECLHLCCLWQKV